MKLFRPSLDGIVAAIKKQFQTSQGTPYTVRIRDHILVMY